MLNALSSIDIESLKSSTPILSVLSCATRLTAKGASGEELTGACPFCGGRDRFNVQPQKQRWLCRHCTEGKWRDVIAFVMLRDSCDFKTACLTLQGDYPSHLPARTVAHVTPPPAPRPIVLPQQDWQAALLRIIERSQHDLLQADAAQAYLARRGLTDRTITRFRLGYSHGYKQDGIWVARGILIPCVVQGQVWYIKIRRLPDDVSQCPLCAKQNKRREVSVGNTCECGWELKKLTAVKRLDNEPVNRMNAVYNAEMLHTSAQCIFVEGEWDVMTIDQELGIPAVTLGSATNKPDLAVWGGYFLHLSRILTVYDNDTAGQQNGFWLHELFHEKERRVTLPDGVKDPNDLFVKAKRLYSWAVKTILTPPQQSKFMRHFTKFQQWGATDAGAARLAWHAATMSGRKWTPAELYEMGLYDDALYILKSSAPQEQQPKKTTIF